eukprot:851774-Rhodomonas_salina.1
MMRPGRTHPHRRHVCAAPAEQQEAGAFATSPGGVVVRRSMDVVMVLLYRDVVAETPRDTRDGLFAIASHQRVIGMCAG